jgi:hypothetical protein
MMPDVAGEAQEPARVALCAGMLLTEGIVPETQWAGATWELVG